MADYVDEFNREIPDTKILEQFNKASDDGSFGFNITDAENRNMTVKKEQFGTELARKIQKQASLVAQETFDKLTGSVVPSHTKTILNTEIFDYSDKTKLDTLTNEQLKQRLVTMAVFSSIVLDLLGNNELKISDEHVKQYEKEGWTVGFDPVIDPNDGSMKFRIRTFKKMALAH